MTAAPERISDSDAYAAGAAAYSDPDFVPCPFEPGSRAEAMWYSGRTDAERMAEVEED